METRRIATACLSTLGTLLPIVCLTTSPLLAQTRFEALTQETIAHAPGLRIVTVRDNVMGACYTLFIMEPAAASAQATEAVVPPVDERSRQSIQRLRDAADKHDRQAAELKTQFEAKTGMTPATARIPGLAVKRNVSLGDSLVRYETERMRIDGEYESVLRAEVPGSYPSATASPGMRTGAWEDAAEATRRAIANPDPSPMKTFADPAGVNSQLASWFERMTDAPRLAAAGPMACTPANANAGKSPR